MKTKLILILLVLIVSTFAYSKTIQGDQASFYEKSFEEICQKIDHSVGDADIPGLSLVFVANDSVFIKNWGYADIENKIPVSQNTLFELGSTSKAFTALAIYKLESEGFLELDSNISKYIPWFTAYYDGKKVDIKLSELLHHTSGIPAESISDIPQGEDKDMLEKTVRFFNNIELKRLPGTEYEYATINYDILGLIIEQISGISFEDYLQQNIFLPLNLANTSVGLPVNGNVAKGYKISFFSPREYKAPRFKGNNPAGYVVSNAKDVAEWLKYQMAAKSDSISELIVKSHEADLSVSPHGGLAYASGWHIDLYKGPKIFHTGLNPNFTSFIGFFPSEKIGIAILANSNSQYTSYYGDLIMKTINNEDTSEIPKPENIVDKTFSLISIILFAFLAGVLVLFVWLIKGIVLGERNIKIPGIKGILKIAGTVFLTAPFILAAYMLPKALSGFSWNAAIIWTSQSFYLGSVLFACSTIAVWLINTMSMLIPTKNKYFRSLPMILILSLMSGLANMVVILILINAIGVETRLAYILYYFTLALFFYIASRKITQTKLINISVSIVYELRVKLINKIFLSSFQKFEKIDNGRVITTLNQDTTTISNSVNIFIILFSNIITIIGVFVYLGTISFVATMLILTVIFLVAALFFFVSRRTNVLFEQARDTANVFTGLIDGLIDGYKELSLSGIKKHQYADEVENSCAELRNKSGKALIEFVNAFLVGETLLIMVLGTVSFIIPLLFPEIPNYKLLGIIMIVLYLIGPINAILNSIPNFMQIKVAWKRVQEFIMEIEPDLKIIDIIKSDKKRIKIEKLSLRDMLYEYKNDDEEKKFRVGPINMDIHKGEVLFVIGGNGSGKSTLANLLTGLYAPDEGFIEINGQKVNNDELGEFYSAIFSNHHVFKKLYGVNLEGKKEEIDYLLKLLRLNDKVNIEDGEYSTIMLSNGQKKRLSLMRCFLEGSQIYLFDEWAADQDPEYKKIFYRELLPKMKKQGKIVIAITHDDNYFDVADRIIKMDAGKIVEYHEKEYVKDGFAIKN